jgi:bacterioferritin
MKGHPDIIEMLNSLLAHELVAVNQYMVHAEMCRIWGHEKLYKADQKRAIDEMRHAKALIGRILFLQGAPALPSLKKKIMTGSSVGAQLFNDHICEEETIASYHEGIKLAVRIGDNVTRELFKSILLDEGKHIEWLEGQMWLEAQFNQMSQIG